jgi:hypothetical protein
MPPTVTTDKVAAIGRMVFLAFCVIAAVFLIYEHTVHVLGVLPYLLLLACPLMHLFMHHGHHHHHHTDSSADGPPVSRDEPNKTHADW